MIKRVGARGRRHLLLRGLATLALVVILFGTGVVVGRGDIYFEGLSTQAARPTYQGQLNYSSVDEAYQTLKANYDGSLDRAKLLDGLKSGLVEAAGDPYTEYFNPAQAKLFNEALSGTFAGIGAELGTDTEGSIVIVAPLAGYPAEKAGLKPKDKIVSINGQSTADTSVGAAVQKIRGPAGTKVTLGIVRGQAAPFEVTITRAKITVVSVKHQVEGNVGYIKISQFTDDTVALAKAAAADFKKQNVKGIVLDLRGNPGGYLKGAVGVSSLWLDEGQAVVTQRRGSQVVGTEYAIGGNILKGLPTVVLVDEGSASASEILAGALGDHDLATLVGIKTFGKGSVQQVERLSGGAELKVTIARWYTPDGGNIDKQGIAPDVTVGLSEEDRKASRDPQKDKAFDLIGAR
ncbi:MAG: S41 family peptidase [Candidatus Saccharimonadales bacterium]